jgi:hypothetical protein
MLNRAAILAIILLQATGLWAAEFNIRDFGATPDDATDDTQAVRAALASCEKAGGGSVVIPAGVYIVSRQASESPILELPSNALIRGEGAASVLKFDARVNQSNFWRLLGAATTGCRNTTICHLRLDGSNTHPKYVPGKTPEHNHGIFLHAEKGVIENIALRDLLIENFSGDCVGVSRGCRNITITGVTVRNFVRQGIQLAGDAHARAYLVSGCQDLEGTVEAGGSTIHVEHANGLSDVIIADNRCRRSILAGGVKRMILRGNVVTGRIEANYNTDTLIQGNVIHGDASKKALIQCGFADGLILRDNIILAAGTPQQAGIYVWGTSRYDANPSKDVCIFDNLVRGTEEPICLNGVDGGTVRDNTIGGTQTVGHAPVLRRCKNVVVIGNRAVNEAKPSASIEAGARNGASPARGEK